MKKFLEATFQWDEWRVTVNLAGFLAAKRLKEGRLVVPAEILITSVTDEPIFHSRMIAVKADAKEQADATELLQFDESKSRSLEIYPVTMTITDVAGHMEQWKFDPRPEREN